MPLNVLPLAHVDVLRVAQPLVYQWHDIRTRGPIQYRIRFLIVRSRKVSKARDRMLNRSVSLWNLAGASIAVLLRRLPYFRSVGTFEPSIPRLWDFSRSYDKTSYTTPSRPEFNNALNLWVQFVMDEFHRACSSAISEWETSSICLRCSMFTLMTWWFCWLRNVCEAVIQISTISARSQKAISLVLVGFMTSEYIMANVYKFVR